MNPKVSVIIPTYNRAQSLSRTIQSVLDQTYQNFELIIVDDGSKDNTDEIIESFHDSRIKYFRHDVNLGGSSARNTGIKNSIGEYLAFLDSDDEWLKRKLELQVHAMESKPSEIWGGVYCSFIYIVDGKDKLVKSVKYGNLKKELLNLEVDVCAGSTLLISKSVVDNVGLFDEKFKRHQDWEFLVRFFRKYKLLSVEEPLVKIYGHNVANGMKASEAKELYLSTFENDINDFGRETAREIRAKHWLFVSYIFAKEKNYSKTIKYFIKSLQYKALPLRTYFNPLISSVFNRFR